MVGRQAVPQAHLWEGRQAGIHAWPCYCDRAVAAPLAAGPQKQSRPQWQADLHHSGSGGGGSRRWAHRDPAVPARVAVGGRQLLAAAGRGAARLAVHAVVVGGVALGARVPAAGAAAGGGVPSQAQRAVRQLTVGGLPSAQAAAQLWRLASRPAAGARRLQHAPRSQVQRLSAAGGSTHLSNTSSTSWPGGTMTERAHSGHTCGSAGRAASPSGT